MNRTLYNNKTMWCIIFLLCATILSCFPILVLKDGGSWTFFSMLFVWLITFFFGTKTGFIYSFIFSFIKIITTFLTEREYFDELMNYPMQNIIGIIFFEYILAFSLFFVGGFLPQNKADINEINSKKPFKSEKSADKSLRSLSENKNTKQEGPNIYKDYPTLPVIHKHSLDAKNNVQGLIGGYLVDVSIVWVCYIISSYSFYPDTQYPNWASSFFTKIFYCISYDFGYLMMEAISTVVILCLPFVQRKIFEFKGIANNPAHDDTASSY